MKKRKLILLLPVLVVAGVLGYKYLDARARDDPNAIRISGNIEVDDAEVSFKLPGRVATRPASEGELIKAGALVARLDASDLEQEVVLRKAEVRASGAALAELLAGSRPEEIAQAEAAVAKAQAKLDELLAGSRPEEIAAAAAAVQRAQATLDEMLAGSRPQEIAAAEAIGRRAEVEEEHLRLEFERVSKLYAEKVATTQQRDAAEAASRTASAKRDEAQEQLKLVKEGPRKEQIEKARAALAEAKAQHDLVKAGPRKEVIAQARAAVAEAQGQLALVRKGPREETIEGSRARLEQTKATLGLAETRLGYATLTSPLAGIVLSENVEPGEYVAPGTPVVTVGDLENVWLRGYINETDLGRVKVGQKVRVATDTYPGKVYEGRVSFIASQAEFTPKNVQTEQERVKLVYRIKVDIPNPAMELKPGMPADAEILLAQAK